MQNKWVFLKVIFLLKLIIYRGMIQEKFCIRVLYLKSCIVIKNTKCLTFFLFQMEPWGKCFLFVRLIVILSGEQIVSHLLAHFIWISRQLNHFFLDWKTNIFGASIVMND